MSKNNTKQEEKKEETKTLTSENKTESIDFKEYDIINQKIQKSINDMLGKENIITVEFLDDDTTVNEYIDSGFKSLNYIMTGKLDGGYPVGRITEISGDPSSGKTLLSTIAAISSVIKGYIVYYIDSEQAYDINFAKLIAKTMGQDSEIVKKINYIQIDKTEEFTKITTKIIEAFEKNKLKTGATIILDSIAFLSTEKETMDVMDGDNKVDMTKAKELRKFFRVLKNKIKHLNICMICTNQLTYNIGVMYGDNKTTTGGTAVPFASSVRIRLSSKKLAHPQNKEKIIGLSLKIKTTKSRLTIPHKTTEIPILFNGQFNKWSGLFDTLLTQDIIKKKNNQTYILGDMEFSKRDFYEKICLNEKNYQKMIEIIKNEFAENPKNFSLEDDNESLKQDMDPDEV